MVKAFAAFLLLAAPAAFAGPKSPASALSQPAKALPVAPSPRTGEDVTTQPGSAAAGTLLADNSGAAPQNSQDLEIMHIPQLPPTKSTRVLDVEPIPSRKAWILLSIADHSAATFDAYSTRYATSRGAREADPMMRPFASSDAIYAAIQAAPVALDFIARHMQRSDSSLLRHTWWLPQSASTGLFLFAGTHNMVTAR
ncbi:MAG TPA: hypothetical protein VNK23_14365 [Candidatus Dormibacteraeota bacterium]|nr:hypothetical protein [Candidatus Dormibacteraeota bacterium]